MRSRSHTTLLRSLVVMLLICVPPASALGDGGTPAEAVLRSAVVGALGHDSADLVYLAGAWI